MQRTRDCGPAGTRKQPRLAMTAAAIRRLACLWYWVSPIVLIAALGCDSRKSEGTDKGGVKPVTIGYFANLTHAQAVLGVASGDLERAVAPSPLRTKVFNAGPSVVEALFAGEVDVAYIGPGPALNAHRQGRGKAIRVIAGAAANGVVIVARRDSGIRSLGDLAGRRIATPQLGNTQDISARHYMLHELKQPDAKNVLAVPNAEQAGMMARGEIDAAWVPEPWGQRLIGEVGAELVAEEKDLWPNRRFSLTVVVTTPQFLSERRNIIEKVLGVHRSWTTRLATEPESCLPALTDALFKLTNKSLPEGTLTAALKRIEFTDEPLEETLRTLARWTYDLDRGRGEIDITGLVDGTLLRAKTPR